MGASSLRLGSDVVSKVYHGSDLVFPSGFVLDADSGTFSLFGQTANIARDRRLVASPATFTISGQIMTFDRSMVAAPASFVVTGNAAALNKSILFSAAAGGFTVSGQDVTLTYIRQLRMPADAGAFTLAGQAVTFDRTMVVQAGAFTLTGYDVTMNKSLLFSAAAGAFTLGGQSAALLYQRSGLAADPASFAMTGSVATFRVGTRLAANAAAYALTGQDAGFNRALRGQADAGAIVLSGQNAGLLWARRFVADAGAYVLTGQAATLTHEEVEGITLTPGSYGDFYYGYSLSPLLPETFGSVSGELYPSNPLQFMLAYGDAGTIYFQGDIVAELLGKAIRVNGVLYPTGENEPGVNWSYDEVNEVTVGQWSDVDGFPPPPELFVVGVPFDFTMEPINPPGDKTLTAEVGPFTLSGMAVNLARGWGPALGASFALTGQAANLRPQRNLLASASSFAMSGKAATLTHTRNPATAFTLVGTTTSAAGTITPHASAQVGDFAVMTDSAWHATVIPTDVLPTGWTRARPSSTIGASSNFMRSNVQFKILEAGDLTAITGMDSTRDSKTMHVFRPNGTISKVHLVSWTVETTAGNPAAQANQAGPLQGLGPAISFAVCNDEGNGNPVIQQTPAASMAVINGGGTSGTATQAGYTIYNDGDTYGLITVDQSDLGNATWLCSGVFFFPIEPVLTMSLVAQSVSETTAISWPAGIQAGDLAILMQYAGDTYSNVIIPGGSSIAYQSIAGGGGTDDCAMSLSGKVCDGTETGSFNGINASTDTTGKAILVFRGDAATNFFAVAPFTMVGIAGDPTAQVVNAQDYLPVIIVLAIAGSQAAGIAADFTSASPAFDGVVYSAAGGTRVAAFGFKIYDVGETPVAHTIDSGDLGSSNGLATGLITVV